MSRSPALLGLFLLSIVAAWGCRSTPPPEPETPPPAHAIVIAGARVPIDAPVVLWTDPGGYDAYSTTNRFSREPGRPGPRYAHRRFEDGAPVLTAQDLAARVDLAVIHYDQTGTSRACFRILHDVRRLSAHFLIDLDGTIYQTLDVRERAFHATIANDRSVGIELANIGAYPPDDDALLDRWYDTADPAHTRLTLPAHEGDGGLRRPDLAFCPARPQRFEGPVHGRPYRMHDYTDAQYASLAALLRALRAALPGITPAAPRDRDGRILTRTLTPDEFAAASGLLGHSHVQSDKIDPGPAFDWERVLEAVASP